MLRKDCKNNRDIAALVVGKDHFCKSGEYCGIVEDIEHELDMAEQRGYDRGMNQKFAITYQKYIAIGMEEAAKLADKAQEHDIANIIRLAAKEI